MGVCKGFPWRFYVHTRERPVFMAKVGGECDKAYKKTNKSYFYALKLNFVKVHYVHFVKR